jgi:hypothetical protein
VSTSTPTFTSLLFVGTLIIFLCVILSNTHLLVISPDGLIQMCSFTYGGQSAEVTTIINDSKIVDRIRGMSWFGLLVPLVIFIISYGSDGVFEG